MARKYLNTIFSCQIYNIRGNLQSDNLQHLQLFTEFGRQAMEEAGPESVPFQDLLFLVRDWNLDDTEGYEGGESLLKKRLEITQKMNDEKRELRQHIKSCFKVSHSFSTLVFYPKPTQIRNFPLIPILEHKSIFDATSR